VIIVYELKSSGDGCLFGRKIVVIDGRENRSEMEESGIHPATPTPC